MKYNLRILPAADADVDAAALFIAKDNFDAALHFYDAVEKAYRQIRDNPRRWPRYPLDHPELADIRKRVIPGFKNFIVFYRVAATTIEIIRVLHGAQDIPSIITASR